jgi:hypothetical protein
MAEKGAKHVDVSLDVNPRFVPVNQGTDSESVAEVMHAWAVTVSRASQADLTR